jgi:DNA-binding CsgD family transcriptional regulator
MLKENQIEAIDYLVVGGHTKSEIAKIVGIGERTLYNWLNNNEFKAEMHRRADIFKSTIKGEAQAYMLNKIGQAMQNIVDIANNSDSDKVRLDANIWMYEAMLGKPTAKIEQSIDSNKDDNSVDIDTLIDDIIEENNVIKIDKIAK